MAGRKKMVVPPTTKIVEEKIDDGKMVEIITTITHFSTHGIFIKGTKTSIPKGLADNFIKNGVAELC